MIRPDSIADGEVRQLDPRYVALEQRVGWIVVGVAVPVLAVGLLFLSIAVRAAALVAAGGLASAAILAGLVWMAVRWPALEYARASYVLDDQGIEIRRGVVWRSVVNVPRSRVQHTDVSQGPLERSYGLGTLVIYTAGTELAQVTLPGLAHETALAIRDHLLPREMPDAV